MTTFELRTQLRRNWACPLLVLTTGACAAPVDATRHTPEERTPSNLVCSDCAPCAANPVAWLIGRDELAESALEGRLLDAGFVPERLPLDRSPAELRGLLFIGSGASSREDYRDYMQQYASHLHDFVDRANTLVQMSQHHGDEPLPPFLPTTQSVKRAKGAFEVVQVLQPEAALLEGTAFLEFSGDPVATTQSTFVDHRGFAVLAAESGAPDRAALLEGAYGQGRIVLSALPLDEPTDDEDWLRFTDGLFRNLKREAKAVCERRTQPLVLEGESLFGEFSPGSSSLVVLPDTQVYSLRIPGLFLLQTAWIAEQASRLDARYTIHLGDIVNNNTELEWQNASDAMRLLNDRVPYLMVPGNHDYGPSGDASTRDTLLNDYFDFGEAKAREGFGGAYEPGKLDNTYHLVSIGGHDLVILGLEWGPRDEVVEWANEIMELHSDREGVLVTHAYLNNNDRRYDHTDDEYPQKYNPHEYSTPGGVNDGEELWQKLVRHHRFIMTLNGHVLGDGTGYLASQTDLGNTCHQLLANYQMRELGGEAYLRLLEFLPNGTTVRVHSYSPLLGDFMSEPDQKFEFELD